MQKKQVEVFYDYICPFCYRGLKYIDDIKDDFPNIEFIYRPSEAHPSNGDDIIFDDAINKGIALLLNQDEIEYQTPVSPIPRSYKAMQAYNYIKENKGDFNKYNNNIYQAVFVKQKDIELITEILECAQDCDVDLVKLEDELNNTNYESKRTQDLEYAYISKKVEYIPTLIYNNKRLDAKPGIGYSKDELIEYLKTL